PRHALSKGADLGCDSPRASEGVLCRVDIGLRRLAHRAERFERSGARAELDLASASVRAAFPERLESALGLSGASEGQREPRVHGPRIAPRVRGADRCEEVGGGGRLVELELRPSEDDRRIGILGARAKRRDETGCLLVALGVDQKFGETKSPDARGVRARCERTKLVKRPVSIAQLPGDERPVTDDRLVRLADDRLEPLELSARVVDAKRVEVEIDAVDEMRRLAVELGLAKGGFRLFELVSREMPARAGTRCKDGVAGRLVLPLAPDVAFAPGEGPGALEEDLRVVGTTEARERKSELIVGTLEPGIDRKEIGELRHGVFGPPTFREREPEVKPLLLGVDPIAQRAPEERLGPRRIARFEPRDAGRSQGPELIG